MSTIVAPLTPVQRSAVILLRVSGPQVKKLFSLFNAAPKPRVSTLCRYISKSKPSVRDDLLLTYFEAPNSYTGEDVLELSFHGNPMIVHAAVTDMLTLGVRLAEPGEFTKRAYLNGKITLPQAEAVDALIRAQSASGVSVAKSTLDGRLDGIFYEIRNGLIKITAELEAYIDFSEEQPNILKSVTEFSVRLQKLADNFNSARLAVNGVRVVIVGAPNAGKSTLFNLLAGRERAIVSDEAGTTRDILLENVSINGVIFALTDTAGVRVSGSKAERAGVLRAIEAADEADIILVLVDATEKFSDEATQLLKSTEGKNRIIVATKCDLVSADAVLFKHDILISAADGANIGRLKEMLTSASAELLQDVNDCAILTERQLHECLLCLKELSYISNGQTEDIQAYHLRGAVQALDRSMGVFAGEDILDEIFSRFCIGK
ncbi:MAG: tRNA uridine-5-carboxymethylaminomethyl(34) synthesis GTPase MnmE [Deferribacteraceae bacterium]|jgi:tRNA modification GTPase|nr:tRNA uridine-5-carboxymethylaminomethyl(34) synthesis GTPase MnmE [Deferribacteraceae bacterium]